MICLWGNKISLKTFTREEHRQFWQQYIPDPTMDPGPFTYDQAKIDARYDSITEKEAWYPRVGIFLPDGTPIGELSFKRIDRELSRCELGIVLANDKFKGKGYGSEAFALAIDYAFNTLNLKYIYADTMGSNHKMQRILKHFGFELLSTDTDYYTMGDCKEDRLNYLLTKSLK